MVKLENCPICDGENWKSFDYLRDHAVWYDNDYRLKDEPVGMKICKDCGFVTYDYTGTEKLKEIYNSQRKIVQPGNVVTCNRKNRYHELFFKPLNIPKDFRILDVGCAQGSMLDFLCHRYQFHRDNCYGTEWSSAFRAVAINEYGFKNITEDIQENTYDMICYYHVLEHVESPDKELARMRELLDDDGFLYISIPIYFNMLDDSSGIDLTFENLYHINHVNMFTEKSFENLLNKTGFKIIKKETTYGYTVLCKKSDANSIEKDDYKKYVDILEKQKKAYDHFIAREFEKAIEVYPKFPNVYIYYALTKENMKDFQAQVDILNRGLDVCENNTKLIAQLAKTYYQWDENKPAKHLTYSNNIRESERLFNLSNSIRPSDDNEYFLGLIESKYKGNYDQAVTHFKKVYEVNPTRFQEMYQLIFHAWKEKYENTTKTT